MRESPFVESLVEKGYEVILFTDPIDEYMMQVHGGQYSMAVQHVGSIWMQGHGAEYNMGRQCMGPSTTWLQYTVQLP